MRSCEVSESPVLEAEALVVQLVVAVGTVPLVVAPPSVRDAEPAPAAVLAARARQAVQCLICNRLAFFGLYTQLGGFHLVRMQNFRDF